MSSHISTCILAKIMRRFVSSIFFFGEAGYSRKKIISLPLSFLTFCMYLAVPTASPQEVKVINITTVSVQLEWKPPPQREQNGRIRGYKVF